VSVSGFTLDGDGALQVRERGRQISLLAQDEAEQVVRPRMSVVEAKRLAECFAGGVQVATPLPRS
jgi:hypothetical protein